MSPAAVPTARFYIGGRVAYIGNTSGGVCLLALSYDIISSGFTDEECKNKLKRWIILGLDVGPDDPWARRTHIKTDARRLESLASHEDLDALLHVRRAARALKYPAAGSGSSTGAAAASSIAGDSGR